MVFRIILVKMENVVETLKVLEMGKFVQWIDNSGLKEPLMTENYTIFTPSNEAVTDYEDETEDVSNLVSLNREQSPSF